MKTLLVIFVLISQLSANTEILQVGDLCGRGGDRQTIPTKPIELVQGAKCDEGLSCSKLGQFVNDSYVAAWYEFYCEERSKEEE